MSSKQQRIAKFEKQLEQAYEDREWAPTGTLRWAEANMAVEGLRYELHKLEKQGRDYKVI